MFKLDRNNRRIQKGEIVSFWDSMVTWQVMGFTMTVDHRLMVEIKRIIPRPQVDGLANAEDLVVR